MIISSGPHFPLLFLRILTKSASGCDTTIVSLRDCDRKLKVNKSTSTRGDNLVFGGVKVHTGGENRTVGW